MKKVIKAVQEVKACRKHEFVQSQCVLEDHSRFHPSVPSELLVMIVP